MQEKKFFVNIDLQSNEVVKLKADTLDITSNPASANTKRIVYYNGQYYYSNGTNWVSLSGGGGGGSVTDVTATTPLFSTGGTSPDISIDQADATTDGYLSSTDWNTFNDKQDALSSGTNIKTINSNSLLGSGNVSVGTVTSVGLTVPSAFSVSNTPITNSGDIAITGAGSPSQYVRGDGTLASFPDIAGGGGGQVFYFNGGTSEGTIGGDSFYQLSAAADLGTNVDFTSGTVNDVVFANFITDVGKPTQETVPAGVWIFQCYLSASATTTCQVYATVEVYNGTSFYVLGTSLVEVLTGGTNIDLYTFTCAVPEYTPLTPSDRIAIRFYPDNLSGNTITLHTQANHLSSVQTTFTTGISSLDGLTASAQYLQTGTAGTDFDITTSGTDIHVFNLPIASAVNTGKLSNSDWTTFNNKSNPIPVSEEGTVITSAVSSINFTGTGVTATAVGNDVTVNVTGGGVAQSTNNLFAYYNFI